MSVVVPMDMPDCCLECPFKRKEELKETIGDGVFKVTWIYNCVYKPEEIEDGWVGFNEASSRRQPFCKLHDLLPHGDLIDRDELYNDWLENGENERIYDTNDFLESLSDAPVIIQGEE